MTWKMKSAQKIGMSIDTEYDLFGMIVTIAVGASHNETSTVG